MVLKCLKLPKYSFKSNFFFQYGGQSNTQNISEIQMAARVFWTCLFLLKNYYIYLQNVNNQQIIGTPHARASAFAVYLSGTTIWNLLASWGKASASVSSIIPRNGVHGPLGPFWYGSLSDIIPLKPKFCSISPLKALLAYKIQGHLLKAFLCQILSLRAKSVLISTTVICC